MGAKVNVSILQSVGRLVLVRDPSLSPLLLLPLVLRYPS
jgi:hypothetical protein